MTIQAKRNLQLLEILHWQHHADIFKVII